MVMGRLNSGLIILSRRLFPYSGFGLEGATALVGASLKRLLGLLLVRVLSGASPLDAHSIAATLWPS